MTFFAKFESVATVSIDASRLDRLLKIIVTAARGDYSVRINLEDVEDDFLELELGINYLLQELADREAQNIEQHARIAASTRVVAEQQEALVAALSTPMITVRRGVLVLPIIGLVDETRAATITTRLLAQVARDQARYVVLDLTGIGACTTTTSAAILRMARALGLLGVTCFMTGIQPEVARQLIEAHDGPFPVRTLAHLSDALAIAIADDKAS